MMKEENTRAAGETKGARRASEVEPAAAGPVRRWSARRKQEAVLRVLRGEPLELVGRELGIETYRLEEWRTRAVAGMEVALRERGDDDPVETQLRDAQRVIGEMAMQNELLRDRIKKKNW
jgi:transposase